MENTKSRNLPNFLLVPNFSFLANCKKKEMRLFWLIFKHCAILQWGEDIYSTFSMSTVSFPGEGLGSGGATNCCWPWPPWPSRPEVNLIRLVLDPGISTLKREIFSLLKRKEKTEITLKGRPEFHRLPFQSIQIPTIFLFQGRKRTVIYQC